MNKVRVLWMGIVLISALLLAGCAQPVVTEEAAELPVVEAPVTGAEAYPVEEFVADIVVEPEIAYPAAEEALEEEELPEEPVPPEDEAVMDDEDAAIQALISEKIGGCHVLNFILAQNKTREEWSVTIDRMIGKGAQVNAEEKEQIIDWLVSREQ